MATRHCNSLALGAKYTQSARIRYVSRGNYRKCLAYVSQGAAFGGKYEQNINGLRAGPAAGDAAQTFKNPHLSWPEPNRASGAQLLGGEVSEEQVGRKWGGAALGEENKNTRPRSWWEPS